MTKKEKRLIEHNRASMDYFDFNIWFLDRHPKEIDLLGDEKEEKYDNTFENEEIFEEIFENLFDY